MRLILSRKGFDSSAGGVASPIFPDGTMVSLPIPSARSPIRYRDITLAGHRAGRVVADLTGGACQGKDGAHLDPDLVAAALPSRQPGWRALFGQHGNAQVMLARAGVGPGDVFLFFGWFRRAEHDRGRFRFAARAGSAHVLWGWLQIDRVFAVATERAAIPRWATYHPHVTGGEHLRDNALYVASERLVLDGVDVGLPGAGVFARHHDRLVLTRPGASRSRWSLPRWFAPTRGRPPLGMHDTRSRWRPAGDRVELESVARGQEFVLDVAHYPEAKAWLEDVIRTGLAAAAAA